MILSLLFLPKDLLLCGPCVQDVKVVGNSLSILRGWNGKITHHLSDALVAEESREPLAEIKEELDARPFEPLQEETRLVVRLIFLYGKKAKVTSAVRK